jgi:hypothetical protein
VSAERNCCSIVLPAEPQSDRRRLQAAIRIAAAGVSRLVEASAPADEDGWRELARPCAARPLLPGVLVLGQDRRSMNWRRDRPAGIPSAAARVGARSGDSEGSLPVHRRRNHRADRVALRCADRLLFDSTITRDTATDRPLYSAH